MAQIAAKQFASIKLADRVEPAIDSCRLDQWFFDPTAKHSPAHRRERFVDDPEESSAASTIGQRRRQLLVSSRRSVEHHKLTG